MVFSSTIFIAFFLPLTLLYFLLPQKLRNYWLLLVSLGFYAWGEPRFVVVMCVSIVINYTFALLIDTYRSKARLRKALLILSVIANLGILFYHKYLDFAILNINRVFGSRLPLMEIALPIGISFFTFQAMSYVIDVYRGTVSAQKNPMYVGMYISLFPQLIAGPIVRYSTIESQIAVRNVTFDDVAYGVRRFIDGFCKKVLLANTLSVLADSAFASVDRSVSFAWLGAIAYAFQIFFDFSGYSDMAIGLGRIFGFRFLENFNYPYISKTISEFWRRWHISLGSWFRDYVYFPLGGSRVKTKLRLVFNLLVVWLLTGAWHGASWNFVLWGLFYFVLISFEKLTGFPQRCNAKAVSIAYQAFTLLLIIVGWVLFRAPDLTQAMIYLKNMLGVGASGFFCAQFFFGIRENAAYLLAALLFSTPVCKLAAEKLSVHHRLATIGHWAAAVIRYALFFAALSSVIISTHNPFIYFNF